MRSFKGDAYHEALREACPAELNDNATIAGRALRDSHILVMWYAYVDYSQGNPFSSVDERIEKVDNPWVATPLPEGMPDHLVISIDGEDVRIPLQHEKSIPGMLH